MLPVIFFKVEAFDVEAHVHAVANGRHDCQEAHHKAKRGEGCAQEVAKDQHQDIDDDSRDRKWCGRV